MALATFPMMSSVQYTCAKIAMVSGRGFAGVLKSHYSKWFLYPAVVGLVVANSINAGADIGAIGAGVNSFLPISIRLLVIPIALAILALQIWGSYRFIANTFRWLTPALFGYVLSAFFCHPQASEVLRNTFIPHIVWNRDFLELVVAILGTTISPYMFFGNAAKRWKKKLLRDARH